jgi:hypothetical protein
MSPRIVPKICSPRDQEPQRLSTLTHMELTAAQKSSYERLLSGVKCPHHPPPQLIESLTPLGIWGNVCLIIDPVRSCDTLSSSCTGT